MTRKHTECYVRHTRNKNKLKSINIGKFPVCTPRDSISPHRPFPGPIYNFSILIATLFLLEIPLHRLFVSLPPCHSFLYFKHSFLFSKSLKFKRHPEKIEVQMWQGKYYERLGDLFVSCRSVSFLVYNCSGCSVNLVVRLSVCNFVYKSECLLVCPFVYLSVYKFSVGMYVCL